MFPSTKTVCLLLAFVFLPLTIAQSPCSDAFLELTKKRNITNCKKLSTLGAEFGWNYHPNHLNRSTIVDILFGVRQDDDIKWIAWGLNPGNRPEMVGTRAVIGVIQNNGSVVVSTYNITSYIKSGCQLFPLDIEFPVLKMTGESSSNTSGYITISGTLVLDTQVYNIEKLNHIWQVGYNADQDRLEPKMHPPTLQNFDSTETLNLTDGRGHGVGHHRRHLRTVSFLLLFIFSF